MRGIHFPAGEDYMEETLMSALNYHSVKKVRAGIKHRETCDFVFHPTTPGKKLKMCEMSIFTFSPLQSWSCFNKPWNHITERSLVYGRQASRLVQRARHKKKRGSKETTKSNDVTGNKRAVLQGWWGKWEQVWGEASAGQLKNGRSVEFEESTCPGRNEWRMERGTEKGSMQRALGWHQPLIDQPKN